MLFKYISRAEISVALLLTVELRLLLLSCIKNIETVQESKISVNFYKR